MARAYGGVAADERRAERYRKLLDAGFDLLAESGPAAITVTGVCARAGLTARYFYEHFANREALLQAVAEAQADAVIELIVAAALAPAAGGQERGENAVRALLEALEADPRRMQVGQHSGKDDAVLRMTATIIAKMTASMIEHAALVWPAAERHPERLRLAASLTVGGVVQMVDDWVEGDSSLSRDELITIAARFSMATGAVVLS